MVGVPALALAALVGSAAYESTDRTVTVSVDGQPRQVSGASGSVGDVLAREGIVVGPQDLVSPPLPARVPDGAAITVRFARPLTLVVDGERRQVWVTATTVGEALQQAGVRADAAGVSPPPAQPLGREGAVVEVRPGAARAAGPDAGTGTGAPPATVGQVPDQGGSGAAASSPRRPSAPSVQRSTRERGPGAARDSGPSRSRTRPASADGRASSAREPEATGSGDPKPRRSGPARRNPAPSSPTPSSPTPSQSPRSTSQHPGPASTPPALPGSTTPTMASPLPTEPPSDLPTEPAPQPTQPAASLPTEPVPASSAPAPTPSPGGDAVIRVDPEPDWAALAACESGGDPTAVLPARRYGLFGIGNDDWALVGGTGFPFEASVEEQLARAKLLYQRRGAAAWPDCAHLF